jgi:hypothetical protein
MTISRKLTLFGFIFTVLVTLSALDVLAAPLRQQAQLIAISYPTSNEVVRGVISITGSATHPTFQRFQITYASEPVYGNDAWRTIGIERTDQVVNGELAIWDTTTLPEGSYSLRLRVYRQDGNYDEIEVRQIVVANSQVTETPTPETETTPGQESAAPDQSDGPPTITPTPLPPTPTILIDQPNVPTATPRALAVVGELPTPRPTNSSALPLPTVEVDTAPFLSSCVLGAGAILILFIFFGFLSALRTFIMGFADRTKGRRN